MYFYSEIFKIVSAFFKLINAFNFTKPHKNEQKIVPNITLLLYEIIFNSNEFK